jgi:hypothetical protein
LQYYFPAQCSIDPPRADSEPELFGLNWELNDSAAIVTTNGETYFEIPGYYDTTSFAKTIQFFQRPITVEIEMRMKPGTSRGTAPDDCLSLELFGSSSCYTTNPQTLFTNVDTAQELVY